MNSDIPFQSECTVSGVLCFVLFVSRIFGLAPLKFENIENGYQIRVSRVYSFYGHALAIISMFSSMTALIADATTNKEKSFRTATNASFFLWAVDLLLVDLVVFACAYTGINRMRCMINCLAQLKQINKEFSRYHASLPRSETNIWILVLFLIFLGCFVNCTDFAVLMTEVVKVNGDVFTSSFYFGHHILYFALKTFAIQFSLIIMSVLPSLQALNCCLKKIYDDTQPQLKPDVICTQGNGRQCKTYKAITSVITSRAVEAVGNVPDNNTTSVTLQRLTLLYCSLCDIVRQLNDCNGLILVMLFLSLLLHLIFTLYHLIMGFFADIANSDHSNGPLQLAWTLYHFSFIPLVVEPCHRTHEQMKQTRILVNKMRRYTHPDDFTAATDLKMFYRHIMLNEATYSPMQLFVINRNLIAAIVGSITTYLIVVIQL